MERFSFRPVPPFSFFAISMAARENSEEDPKLFTLQQNTKYVGHSNHSIKALYSNPQTHLRELNDFKLMAFNTKGRSRMERTNSAVLQTVISNGGRSSELSVTQLDDEEDDPEVKSDAESWCCHEVEVDDDVWEDEQCIDGLLFEEGTRKKIELLAGMVGVDSSEPGVVLAEVVRVLKDLERRNGYQHFI